MRLNCLILYHPFGIDELTLKLSAKKCLLDFPLEDLLFYVDRLRPFSCENRTISNRLDRLAGIVIENYGLLTDQDTSADLKRYFHNGSVYQNRKPEELAA